MSVKGVRYMCQVVVSPTSGGCRSLQYFIQIELHVGTVVDPAGVMPGVGGCLRGGGEGDGVLVVLMVVMVVVRVMVMVVVVVYAVRVMVLEMMVVRMVLMVLISVVFWFWRWWRPLLTSVEVKDPLLAALVNTLA